MESVDLPSVATSPWSHYCARDYLGLWNTTNVLHSVVSHLCWPTSAHCRLLVRAKAHIVLLASLTSHINRGRRESFHSYMFIDSLLFTLMMRCDLEKSAH
jgi:hypothetical protein